jgi:ribose transport system substrate-binding protein
LPDGRGYGILGSVKIGIKAGLVVTGTLAACSLLMSVFLVGGLSESDASSVLAGRPSRHFALYLPQNKTAYFSDIMNGALKSASENGAALSVHALDQSGDALKMAAYSGLDGIVVCPDLDDEVIFKSLSFLTANGVPLVLVNHNIPAEQPCPSSGRTTSTWAERSPNSSLRSTAGT